MRLRWLGSDALTWRDLFVVLRNLPADSAVHQSTGAVPISVQLSAILVDGVNTLVWQKSKDGHNNTNRPKSVYDQIVKDQQSRELEASDVEDFDAWYAARFAKN